MISLRIRRRKWHVVDPIRDLRECPECACLVHDWGGQWRHKEHHEAMAGKPEPEDPGGIIYGNAMTPADAEYLKSSTEDETASYWDG